jgi:hypothetical protein
MKNSQAIYDIPHGALAHGALEEWPIATSSPARTGKYRGKKEFIRIGFIALTDCAPQHDGGVDYGNGCSEPCPGFNIFSRNNANEPDARKAAWVPRTMISSGLASAAQIPRDSGEKCFRADIFSRALALTASALVPSAA